MTESYEEFWGLANSGGKNSAGGSPPSSGDHCTEKKGAVLTPTFEYAGTTDVSQRLACFTCGSTGHRSKFCPDRREAAPIASFNDYEENNKLSANAESRNTSDAKFPVGTAGSLKPFGFSTARRPSFSEEKDIASDDFSDDGWEIPPRAQRLVAAVPSRIIDGDHNNQASVFRAKSIDGDDFGAKFPDNFENEYPDDKSSQFGGFSGADGSNGCSHCNSNEHRGYQCPFEVGMHITSNCGMNPPEKIMKFDDAAFTDSVAKNIRRHGYLRPTPIQQCAIPTILDGHDMISVSQTGSGKTAAFLLPVIHHLLLSNDLNSPSVVCRPRCLILVPTRELGIQILRECRKFCENSGLSCACIYGGTSSERSLKAIAEGPTILVATIGRILHLINDGHLSTEKVRFFILDEADRMMDDNSFGKDVRFICSSPMPPPGIRQTMMFSATFQRHLQVISAEVLDKNYMMVNARENESVNKCITQSFIEVTRATKFTVLLELLGIDDVEYTKSKASIKEKTIIFVEEKKMADVLGVAICEAGIPCTTIHGGRYQLQREEVLRKFEQGNKSLLIATSVAERGLDIRGLYHVINYDLPGCIDSYVNRIGRTGRLGITGRATSLFDPNKDKRLSAGLVRTLKLAGQAVPSFIGGGSEAEDTTAAGRW